MSEELPIVSVFVTKTRKAILLHFSLQSHNQFLTRQLFLPLC